MSRTVKITAFAGSLRSGSYNRGLLRAAVELAPEGMEIEIRALDEIPFYDADVEAEGVPDPVAELRRAVEAADGLLIATPEYNSGIPGVLKNTVDWLSRPPRPQAFDGKPVAIVGATPGRFGTRAAQYQLRQVLTPLNALTMVQPQLLVRAAAAKFDDQVRLTDEDTRQRLERLLATFGDWARRLSD